MTGRSLPGCQYMSNWANHRHRESLIHSVEKRSLSRIDPSVIFPLRSAVKWAILKYKMLGLEADACCCEVYLLTFASSDAWVEGRKQIMYATKIRQWIIYWSLDSMKSFSDDSMAEKKTGKGLWMNPEADHSGKNCGVQKVLGSGWAWPSVNHV